MKKNKNTQKNKFSIILLAFFGTISYCQESSLLIWNKSIPNSIDAPYYLEKEIIKEGEIQSTSQVTTPLLYKYQPKKTVTNGSAILICPGGGYSHLAMYKEGKKVALWLNSLGITAFVLKYRMPTDLIMKDKSIGPLQDAQEAIRTIRRNSKEWKIDPAKIGVLGFSAGGHLASTLATHYLDRVYDADATSARPDFSILIYPVISMEDGITHNGSKVSLLGQNATKELTEKYSNEKQIDANSPKTFIVHSTDDKVVPVENSIQYYMNLKKFNVPVEMHLYENGGHGFGLGTKGTHTEWPKACAKWLNENFLLN